MSRKIKIRSFLIGGLFTLFFVIVGIRLYYVQVVQAHDLTEKAVRVWSADSVLPSTRGAIYDRNGNVLAWNAPSYTVAVNPGLIHQRGLADKVVSGLAPLLGMDHEAGYRKLQQLVTKKREDGSYYVHVEVRNEGWKIDSDVADRIRSWMSENDIVGVNLLQDNKRYYPNGSLASHVLGYTDKDGNAIMGIEYTLDGILKGKDGKIHYERDRLGYELPKGTALYEPPVNGKSVRLTIDQNIQHYMEAALEEVYNKYEPISVTAIAADPNTLEILGMANYPNFDPNRYWDIKSQADFYNHAISSIYEPGSTFKIVTLAAAVEEGLFDPDETYMSGRIRVADTYINDHNGGRGWGEITYLEGFLRSSNVAFVQLGQRLGGEKLRYYIEQFGFGVKTGIELSSEARGDVRFNLNYPTEVATATFGQGRVTVTGIQQVAAISAIANGGKLLKPHLVKEIIDSDTGETVEEFGPQFIRQVVSERTAHEVAGYLEQVVSNQSYGTGRRAYIEGYRIAAKTGTAEKVVDGKYADDRYVLSFGGFAPVDDPKIALIVIVDDPKIESYTQGSEVVAPVFREIMEKSLRYLGVETERSEVTVNSVQIQSKLPTLTVPNLVTMDPLRAGEVLAAKGFGYVILGNGHKVIDQFPASGTRVGSRQQVILLTQDKSRALLPDMSGWSLRDAMELATYLDIKVRVSGEGYVVRQYWQGNGEEQLLHLELQPPAAASETQVSPESVGEPSADGNSSD